MITVARFVESLAEEELGDVYSAGATIDLVRLCLAEVNAHPDWIAATDDIKTAFLRAPIPELPNGKRYAMEAPRAMIRAGLAEPGELWLATAAVYGFQRSPKWWSQHRNTTTAKASWKFKEWWCDEDCLASRTRTCAS